MDREVFPDHLLRASAQCREFTAPFVFDSIPDSYAFWVMLNCSYDLNPLLEGEIAFPDDVQKHGKRPAVSDGAGCGPLTAAARPCEIPAS
jgi:hypothetical protein